MCSYRRKIKLIQDDGPKHILRTKLYNEEKKFKVTHSKHSLW